MMFVPFEPKTGESRHCGCTFYSALGDMVRAIAWVEVSKTRDEFDSYKRIGTIKLDDEQSK